MHSFRSLGSGSSPAALPALLRATHLLGLALGSALGRRRESGATAARLFERAEESALLLRMIPAEDLRRKVELGLVHYAHFRPHEALGGSTPAEIYFGRTPEHLSAIPPPRGRPGHAATAPRLGIRFLDSERRLPVLLRKAS